MSIPIMAVFDAEAGGFFSVLGSAVTSIDKLGDSAEMSSAKMGKIKDALAVGIVGAAAIVATKSAEMAIDFDDKMHLLVTSAGLPKAAMDEFGDALKRVSVETGASLDDLADASYKALSQLKFNWQDTATVMEGAAKLAIIDNSDLTTTTQALSTAIHDYGATAADTTSYVNGFRAAVADSNTTIGDFSARIGKTLETAHALHIGFDQVTGALATLTSEGMDANSANTLLSSTMLRLTDQTPAAAKEWDALSQTLGDTSLSATNFEKTLSEQGLTGALGMLQGAINKAAGPDGFLQLQDAVKKTKDGTADFQTEFDHLPTKVQSSVAAVANIAGGVKGLGIILGLTGDNLKDFVKNVGDVKTAMGDTKEVEMWNEKQDSARQKLEKLKASVHVLAVNLGDHLLPAIKSVADALSATIVFFENHTVAAKALEVVLSVVLAGAFLRVAAMALGFVGSGLKMVKSLFDIKGAIKGVGDIASSVKGGFTALKSGFDTARLAAMYAKDGISEWATFMRAGFANAVETAGTKFLMLKTAVSEFATGALQDLQIRTLMAKDKIAEAAESISGKLKTMGRAVADGARDVANFSKKVATDLATAVKDGAVKVGELATSFGRMAAAKIGELASGIASFGKALAIAAANGMRAMITATWEFTAALLANPMTWIILAIIAAIALLVAAGIYLWKHWDEIWAAVTRIAGEAADWVTNKWNEFCAFWRGIWDDICGIVDRAGQWVYDHIVKPIQNATHFVTNIDWPGLGRDIIMGIVHGLQAAGHAIEEMLMNLARDALNAVKSFFGISSPSKVFADEVGHWIPHGIAAGIDSQAHVVAASLKRAVDPRGMNLSANFGATVGASYRPPFGAGAGAGGPAIVVNVAANGTYYGMGGAKQAAVDIRGELLRMGVHTNLGLG